ncbi:MAG: hypothetical protein AAB794_01465 [Patescibacteria group bacterium]
MRLAVLTLSLLLPAVVTAQFMGSIGNTAPFTVSINPQYPAPYSRMTLSIESSSLDLANATMTVTSGGKNVYQGSVRPVALSLGKAGGVTQVEVTIVVGGTNYRQTVSIQPQDVSLVAEPISSAPPLYPGKPSVPVEGSARVVAVANFRTAGGVSVDSSTLTYKWVVDDTRIANSSGIGKSAIIVASPLQYRARDVSVEVTNQGGTLVGGSTVSLSPQEPSMRIYENDPLLGIRFDRALIGSFSITGAESTLYGAPFSLPTARGAPFLQWFVNGSPAQTGSSITLRPTGDGQGTASLSLTASSGSTLTASMDLSLLFGATESSNFFGL